MSGSGLTSLGRGGAGNMVDATMSPKVQAQDLVTPTLKTPMVTTGRGGQGNMAKNVDAEETRARQDVEPVARRGSHGAAHSGRGGAGNFFQEGEVAKHSSNNNNNNNNSNNKNSNNNTSLEDKAEGLAARGKALLFGKKDKSESK